jgi:ABC-2 type transport system ATP-binding protein
VLAEPAALRGVAKYYGSACAVSGLDFAIRPGEVTVLLGPNGAGKSTTLNMVAGLRRPSRGSVSVFGGDPCSFQTRRRMGVMLQESGVPPTLTVRELIAMFSRLYPAPLSPGQVVSMATLEGKLDARAGSLSGGQRQRLYFALATCGDPDLLLLDEPTVAMDVESRAASLEQIRSFAAAGKAVLFTTHYLREADQVADRVIVINQGQLVIDGSSQEVTALATGKQVSFAAAKVLEPRDFDGLPADGLRLEQVTGATGPASRATFHSSRPEDVLAAFALRGIRLSDLEVAGADLEQAVTMLLHRVPSSGPEPAREPQAAREREAVLAHSADPPVNQKSLWKRRS